MEAWQSGVDWFPQEWAVEFFVVKGMVALASTLMLLYHMNSVWNFLAHHAPLGQRLRYFTLLGYSILVTAASAEQVQEGVLVSYRNLGGLLVTLLLIVAMVVSIRETTRLQERTETG